MKAIATRDVWGPLEGVFTLMYQGQIYDIDPDNNYAHLFEDPETRKRIKEPPPPPPPKVESKPVDISEIAKVVAEVLRQKEEIDNPTKRGPGRPRLETDR